MGLALNMDIRSILSFGLFTATVEEPVEEVTFDLSDLKVMDKLILDNIYKYGSYECTRQYNPVNLIKKGMIEVEDDDDYFGGVIYVFTEAFEDFYDSVKLDGGQH